MKKISDLLKLLKHTSIANEFSQGIKYSKTFCEPVIEKLESTKPFRRLAVPLRKELTQPLFAGGVDPSPETSMVSV